MQLQYVNPSSEEFDSLVSALKVQMEDGQGEVIIELGIGGEGIVDLSTCTLLC